MQWAPRWIRDRVQTATAVHAAHDAVDVVVGVAPIVARVTLARTARCLAEPAAATRAMLETEAKQARHATMNRAISPHRR
jgi:hypothetical protein